MLAGVERIPPSTIRKLEEFAKGGGILIATRKIPSLAPGFKATDEDQKTVRETAERLFKDPGARVFSWNRIAVWAKPWQRAYPRTSSSSRQRRILVSCIAVPAPAKSTL